MKHDPKEIEAVRRELVKGEQSGISPHTPEQIRAKLLEEIEATEKNQD